MHYLAGRRSWTRKIRPRPNGTAADNGRYLFAFGACRRDDIRMNFDSDRWPGCVIDMARNLFDDGRDTLHRPGFDAVHAPRHFRNVDRILAVDIFIEHLLELIATLLPLLRSLHRRSIAHDQDI